MTRRTIARMAGLQLTLGALLMLSAAGASAQLYKWIDEKGAVHFSDTPPPSNVKLAPIKASAGGADQVPLPYALAQAARSHPVVLYTSAGCEPCGTARAHLKRRGIPFAEKTVETADDQAKLKAAVNSTQVPALLIGRNKKVGYEPGGWDAALSNAAYPAESILPKNYAYPAAVAAAPVVPVAEKPAVTTAAKPAPSAPTPAPTAPPGFQF